MKLTDGEKLIILMLADMYKAQKIKGDFDPNFIASTIHSDHLWGFNWQYTGIPFDPHETPRDVTETGNILDMWMLIEEGYAELSSAEKTRVEKEAEPFGKHVKFRGFDANNEPHYGIANYLIEDLKRFSHFKGRDMNSHMPLVGAYRRMYSVFEPMRASLFSSNLNADQIIQILNEMVHPENRKL
jgi:uncharacterized protein YfbU (UPF0304 family)